MLWPLRTILRLTSCWVFFDDVMSLFATERRGGFSAAEIELLHLVTPVFALALGARLNAAAPAFCFRPISGRCGDNARWSCGPW
jgi:hypothetical protein